MLNIISFFQKNLLLLVKNIFLENYFFWTFFVSIATLKAELFPSPSALWPFLRAISTLNLYDVDYFIISYYLTTSILLSMFLIFLSKMYIILLFLLSQSYLFQKVILITYCFYLQFILSPILFQSNFLYYFSLLLLIILLLLFLFSFVMILL